VPVVRPAAQVVRRYLDQPAARARRTMPKSNTPRKNSGKIVMMSNRSTG